MAEIVYILTNPVMPGVVKIGKTDKEEVQARVRELFTTGVPVPFDCVYASVVENNEDVEKLLHRKFSEARINPRREFFWLDSVNAVAALKPHELSDVTPEVRADADSAIPEVEKNARWNARQKTIDETPEYAEGKDLHLKIPKTASVDEIGDTSRGC
ncbi:MAG: GIY-YIG nuclease family protein [Oscillospiraceae bacterium]|jgi:hypothetical protein|nr:GIY-YIG nuclease family protein [Oscillospiraceae bacterium]